MADWGIATTTYPLSTGLMFPHTEVLGYVKDIVNIPSLLDVELWRTKYHFHPLAYRILRALILQIVML